MRPLSLLALSVLGLAGCSQASAEPPSQAEVFDRYVEVALSCEYADCAGGIVKPSETVSVVLESEAREDQVAALEDTISQWNAACPALPMMLGGDSETTMAFYFVDEANMVDVLPVYVEGNVGLFNYDWDGANVITGMTVAIANEITSDEMHHFVLEETTQAMGLVNDVVDRKSIFDAGLGRTVTYSALDQAIIGLHCDEQVVPGMTQAQLEELFFTAQ